MPTDYTSCDIGIFIIYEAFTTRAASLAVFPSLFKSSFPELHWHVPRWELAVDLLERVPVKVGVQVVPSFEGTSRVDTEL